MWNESYKRRWIDECRKMATWCENDDLMWLEDGSQNDDSTNNILPPRSRF
jgi:hypothetical protein